MSEHIETQQGLVPYQLLGTLEGLAQGSLGRGLSDQRAVEVLTQAAAHRVPVLMRNGATCMDGRPVGRMLPHDPSREGANRLKHIVVRAKMAGGTAISGFLGEDWSRTYRGVGSDKSEEVPVTDIVETRFKPWAQRNPDRLGFHVAEQAHAPGCGCGMCDNAPAVAELIMNDAQQSGGGLLVPTVTALMRGPFRDEVHAGLLQDVGEFWLQAEGPDDDPGGSAAWNGQRVLETIRSVTNPLLFEASVEVSAGDHLEDLGVISYGNTTLHRDAFVQNTGHYAFWIDEPAVMREAMAQAARPDNADEVHARYQTMMTAQVAGSAALVNEEIQFATLGEKPAFAIPKAA